MLHRAWATPRERVQLLPDLPVDPEIIPNPFKEAFTVALPRSEYVQEVKIISLNGSVVYVKAVKKMTARINIRPDVALSPGMYVVQVTTQVRQYTLRAVKQ